jgi:ferric-dicitrate binding protein FerR (iron transport regulator)
MLPLDGRVVVSVPADAMDAPPATAPVPPPRPRARRLWTWVAAGAAAGLALASLGCWLGAESEYRSWQDLVSETPAPPDAEARLASLESATRRREIASWSLLGAAGAAAVVTAVLFWVEGRERRAPARVTARARGAGAVLGVSF